MVQLIYVSVPTIDSAVAASNFIFAAQEFNKSANIGGMLVSAPNFYVQVLEGDRLAVNALYNRIARDPRHKNVTIVRYMEIRYKEFPEWSMLHVNFADIKRYFMASVVQPSDITPENLSGVSSLALIRRLAALVRISSGAEQEATTFEITD